MSALLSARGLEVTFLGRHGRTDAKAVDGVDLDVAPGEILALVGESGCGKTTLARTMLGLEIPTGGEVAYDGKPLGYDRRYLTISTSTPGRGSRTSSMRRTTSTSTPPALPRRRSCTTS